MLNCESQRSKWAKHLHQDMSYWHRALAEPGQLPQAFVREPNTPCRIVTVHGMEENWDVFEEALGYVEQPGITRLELPWSGREGYHWSLDDVPLGERLGHAFAALDSFPEVVIAHSFGTAALLSYLRHYGAAEFKALVLISPFVLFPGKPFDWARLDYFAGFYRTFLENTVSVRVRRPLDPDIKTRMAEHIRDKIGPLGCIVSLHELIKTQEVDFSKIHTPTLIITGSEDFYAPPEVCRHLAEALPQGRAIIMENCGHFSMIDQPEAVGRLIHDFIQQSVRYPYEKHHIESESLAYEPASAV